MAVRHAGHEQAQPQPLGAARDEAERGVALEHRILGRRHPVHLEVVVHERHGADAHGLGALGEVGDAGPDAGRTAGPVESHDVEIKLHTVVLYPGRTSPLQRAVSVAVFDFCTD